MHMGLLNYFDKAESAFVSAYRKHSTEEEFEVHIEYMAAPKVDNKVFIPKKKLKVEPLGHSCVGGLLKDCVGRASPPSTPFLSLCLHMPLK